VYGLVMATVLESVPRKARGIVGGFTQQGFAAGYMLASGFHLAMCEKLPHRSIPSKDLTNMQ
jgi:MFS transporter, SHS family, lactate transporter